MNQIINRQHDANFNNQGKDIKNIVNRRKHSESNKEKNSSKAKDYIYIGFNGLK